MASHSEHYVLPRPAFDKPVKILIVVSPYYKDIADNLGEGVEGYSLVDSPVEVPDVVIVFAPIDREAIVSDPRLEGLQLFSFGRPADLGSGSSIDSALLPSRGDLIRRHTHYRQVIFADTGMLQSTHQ